MKTVFSTHELPHVWARQTQLSGRTSNGSMFFEGKEIYSYGRHFCIARILDNGMVLVTDRKYSNTTAKHKSLVSGAILHMERITIAFPEDRDLSSRNVSAITKAIREQRNIITNKRCRPESRESAKGTARAIVSEFEKYMRVMEFDIRKKNAVLGEIGEAIRTECIAYMEYTRTLNEETLSDEIQAIVKKQEQAEKRKKAARQKELMARLADWLKGTRSTNDVYELENVYLRAKDKEIQTSKGAVVSLKAGRVLFKMIQAGKDVLGHKIDGYTVTGLNGVLSIGCHKIERSEIDRFAKSQGWIK
jgi:hypothetical protein